MLLRPEAHSLHLSPPAGRGRIASAIRVRGALRKGGGNRFKNADQILRNIVVPKPQNATALASQELGSRGSAT